MKVLVCLSFIWGESSTLSCALAILVPAVLVKCAPSTPQSTPQSKPYCFQPPKTRICFGIRYGTVQYTIRYSTVFYNSTIYDSTVSFCTEFQGDRMQHVPVHPTGVARRACVRAAAAAVRRARGGAAAASSAVVRARRSARRRGGYVP